MTGEVHTRFPFLHDLTKDGIVKMVYCKSEEQIAEILTKPLKVETFLKLRGLLEMCSNTYIN